MPRTSEAPAREPPYQPGAAATGPPGAPPRWRFGPLGGQRQRPVPRARPRAGERNVAIDDQRRAYARYGGPAERRSVPFNQISDRLRPMVQREMDRRVHGGVGGFDVLRETYLEVSSQYDETRRATSMSRMLWLHFNVVKRFLIFHRIPRGVKA